MTQSRVYRWRRADGATLEVLRMLPGEQGFRVCSTLVAATKDAFSVRYEWLIDARWSTRALSLHLARDRVHRMIIERAGETAWRIDGHLRPDLDGCEEIDLSITPFCNTLALRRFGPPPGAAGELTTLYVEFPELSCAPSRQRYDRRADGSFTYVDLGLHSGFEAHLIVDPDGIVLSYEQLFERVEPDNAN